MNLLIFLGFLLVSFLLSLLCYPYVIGLLSTTGCIRQNWRGIRTVTSSGLLITIVLLGEVALFALIVPGQLLAFSKWLFSVVPLTVAVALFGILDDILGDRSARGFKGHLGQLRKGRLTTGALKAIGGTAASFLAVWPFSDNLGLFFLNGLLVASFINVFNLLDLRPGRAIKVFLVLGTILFAVSYQNPFWVLGGIFIGVVIVLLIADLTERSMLGDVGSNVLGAVIGLSFVVNFSWVVKLIALGVTLLVQLYAEKWSISDFVEKVAPLRWFDEWGRRKS